jgi:hypothetical protein
MERLVLGGNSGNRGKTAVTASAVALVCVMTVSSFAQDDPFPEATFLFQTGSAAPGETTSTQMLVNATLDLQALSVSINYDEGILEATDVLPVFEFEGREEWYFLAFDFDGTNNTPGEAGVDEGWVWAAGLFGLGAEDNYWEAIPQRDQDNHIFDFSFRVRDNAPVGTTDIVFIDGAPSPNPNVPVTNVAALEGQDVPLKFDVAPLFVSGGLAITNAGSPFLRADSDSNRAVEINDAIFTLEYLFFGATPPECMAAADANADGGVDITDPIVTLKHLILGTEEVPSSTDDEDC